MVEPKREPVSTSERNPTQTKLEVVAERSSPLEQAIVLREALWTVTGQANELVRSLKRRQRSTRLVESTLASLKQLQKVAG